jgi:hypothetical protein
MMTSPKVVKHLAYAATFIKKGKFLSGHSGGGPSKTAPCDGYLISFSTAELEKNSESLAFQDAVFLPLSLIPGMEGERIKVDFVVDASEVNKALAAFALPKKKKGKK